MQQYDLERLGFKLVSQVWVDSGQLLIVDPCYLLPDKRDWEDNVARAKPGKDGHITYNDILDYYEETGFYDRKKPLSADQENDGVNPWGIGVGYVTSSGYGDGCYNVYARHEDQGDGFGKRVQQILIDFQGLEEDESDDYEDDWLDDLIPEDEEEDLLDIDDRV